MSDFNFSDLEMTLKSHPRSKVMTHFNQVGHAEHFVLPAPLAYTGNGLAAMGDFHFRDLEMTPLEVIQGQGHCGF